MKLISQNRKHFRPQLAQVVNNTFQTNQVITFLILSLVKSCRPKQQHVNCDTQVKQNIMNQKEQV